MQGFSASCNEMLTIAQVPEPVSYSYFSCDAPSSALQAPARSVPSTPTLGIIIIATQNPPRKGAVSPSVRRFEPNAASVEYVSHLLHTYFVNDKPDKHLQLIGPDGIAEDIPLEIYAVLREVFQHLKDGQAISLIPDDTLLTTQQAAEILNISRPYLYRLLDAREIPFIRIGTHRKLRLADVEALRQRRRSESRKALDAIVTLNQEYDDYGDDYGEPSRE